MNSYNSINYKLRPQKQIERGIFSDLINGFTYIQGTPVNYIGMGSLFFADFTYFYKKCQLNRMISIEQMLDSEGNFDYAKHNRFLNNKPLEKIELIPKLVGDAIGDLPFDSSAFIWLDYDGQMFPGIIDDLEKILMQITHSSVLVLSINRGVHPDYKSKGEVYIDKCEEEYARYRVNSRSVDNFTQDTYTRVALEICDHYLQEKCNTYNGLYSKTLELKQIGNIAYQDGASMYTMVWSVINNNETHASELKAYFDEFEAKEGLNLKMEHLTLYEKQILDRCPKAELDEKIKEIGLDQESVEQYYKYAKYIPEYSEVYI